jgi:Flp pilus assembly protein TadG
MTAGHPTSPPGKHEGPFGPAWAALKARCRDAWRREDGTATVEFVLVVPLILFIFMSAIEAGVLMTRQMMLVQAVDITMRDLRLGLITNPTVGKIKTEVCDLASILPNCDAEIRIELTPISTSTWSMPSSRVGCFDRSQNVQPALTFNTGSAHEVMLVRVCVPQETMFPTTAVGLSMAKDSGDKYGLVVTSAFVNEP